MANKNTSVLCEAKSSPVYFLKEVLKTVKLDDNLKKENNAILQEFLNTFIEEMKKCDELFKFLYQRPYYTGSYYIDLRISEPDEFDLNLVLKLPFKATDFDITPQSQTPSYVKYRLKDPAKASVEHPRLVSLLFSDGYLMPENVRKWLQSLVDKAMINYKAPSQCLQNYFYYFKPYRNKNGFKNNRNESYYRIGSNYRNRSDYRNASDYGGNKYRNKSDYGNGNNDTNESNYRNGSHCGNGSNYQNSHNYRRGNNYRKRKKAVFTRQSGPARTIFLRKRNGGQIDIDLVPVIESSLDLPTASLDKRISGKYGNNLQAFLVPKPYSHTKQMPINKKEAICLWRTHFPDTEKALITDIGCVKPIIKLLKLLRDKENWKALASYYLKTLVMLMILDNPNKDYWKEDKMFDRFLEALQKLSTYVEQRKIPYLFNKKYNLISKINPEQASNIHNRLKYFIRILKENPKRLWEIFQIKQLTSNY